MAACKSITAVKFLIGKGSIVAARDLVRTNRRPGHAVYRTRFLERKYSTSRGSS